MAQTSHYLSQPHYSNTDWHVGSIATWQEMPNLCPVVDGARFLHCGDAEGILQAIPPGPLLETIRACALACCWRGSAMISVLMKRANVTGRSTSTHQMTASHVDRVRGGTLRCLRIPQHRLPMSPILIAVPIRLLAMQGRNKLVSRFCVWCKCAGTGIACTQADAAAVLASAS